MRTYIDRYRKRFKAILVSALLLTGGLAQAQVVIKGNVYGGGLEGQVKNPSASVFGNATVTINDGKVEGSVFGGGEGVLTNETSGLVQGNTTVTMKGGVVERSIYGGGSLGSVGTFTTTTITYNDAGDPNGNNGVEVQMPTGCTPGTGLATVKVSGGSVGLEGSLMPWNNHDPNEDDRGWIFCGGAGDVDSINNPRVIAMAVVNATELEISGDALITASVYGGCENGLVLDSTWVKIKGGQIGTGLVSKSGTPVTGTFDNFMYEEEKWTAAKNAIKDGTIETALGSGGSLENYFHECDAWDYGDGSNPQQYNVYDIYWGTSGYNPENTDAEGSNGQSFFGNVFGGGSGFYPMAAGIWRRSAGRVNGNTRVEITGGHILTAVYGGNEVTDVKGKATVIMTNGTIGVPRTLEQIEAHPVTNYFFGAGRGDSRVLFNTWTNVQNTVIEIGGGTNPDDEAFIFGSIVGGGEDGHVLDNVNLTIKEKAWIGTYGYTGYDGNVFGSGRGFSGEALTAGAVGGNVNVDIEGGTMLGSIYGGGRLASVGTMFADPTLPGGAPNPAYGQMQTGDDHGIVTVNISGGTIGNDYEAVTHTDFDTISTGGNVFAGSMGSLTTLSGTTNEIWPNLAKVKRTILNISEANAAKPTIIKGNVFGGGKVGTVTDSTSVNISGGTIWRDVYGGGYGDPDHTRLGKLKVYDGESVTEKNVYPMQWAGRVEGNTNVNITGGWIKKSVYGGGEMASVGTITDSTRHIQTGSSGSGVMVHPLYLSWPYEFTYANKYNEPTGRATVKVKGGRIGMTGKDYMGPWKKDGEGEWKPIYYDNGNAVFYDLTSTSDLEKLDEAIQDNGDVYGGSKGKAGSTYVMAHVGNVNQTVVSIKYPNNNTTPTNYKPTTGDPGLEHDDLGHAIGYYPTWTEWKTTLGENAERGCVAGAVYGGAEDGHVNDSTSITLNKGLVGHAIYGGGKGKGNYKVNGQKTYSLTAGKVYGNTHITVKDGYVVRSVFGGGNLASVGKGNYIGIENGETTTDDDIIALANAYGHTHVNIYGGTIGMLPIDKTKPDDVIKDSIPYGSVFGGARGRVVNGSADKDDFFGYVNFTHVNIGKTVGSLTNPRLYGSVYGGAQDGHVRRNTNVTVNAGEIGVEFVDETTASNTVGSNDPKSRYWTTRGNVYGGGSGVGPYDENTLGTYSPIAGSVLDSTNVTIKGGLIHRNVFGGGNLASVNGEATVNIESTIGIAERTFADYATYDYGGYVYGGGRGILNTSMLSTYAHTGSTQVNIKPNALVPGEVYGGGAFGQVKTDAKVNMTGGEVGVMTYPTTTSLAHLGQGDGGGSVFGGGMGDVDFPEAARVLRNTDVTISGGHVYYSVYGGGKIASVGLSDDDFEYTIGTTTFHDRIPKKNDANENTGLAQVTITGGQVGPAPRRGDGYNIPIGLNGRDGYVFGGGKGIGNDPIPSALTYGLYSGQYFDIADVNNTLVTVNIPMKDDLGNPVDSTLNRIWGSVFGGAEDGHVLGNARVKYLSGYMGTKGTTSYDGNIFGGGRNYERKNYNAGRVRSNIKVEMSGGQIFGSIFGGGRLALTGVDLYGNIIPDGIEGAGSKYGDVYVKVNGGKVGNDKPVTVTGLGDVPYILTFTEHTMGDVYGGGKGSMDGIDVANHPKASALLLSLIKNTTVVVTDSVDSVSGDLISPTILGSVFGGGEVANVGYYTWKIADYSSSGSTETIGDIALVDGTGIATVNISGGTIGIPKMRMLYDIAGDPDDGNFDLKYNCDLGHVFGGGEGRNDNPDDYATINPPSDPDDPDIHSNKSLLDLMATVGETHVTISKTTNSGTGAEIGSAFVKGSVYGGGMNGHVMGNTNITVSGGQIGAGYNASGDDLDKYTSWMNPLSCTYTADGDIQNSDALAECHSWPYDKNTNRPFNAKAIKEDTDQTNHSNSKPTDGKTWYGSVFGGGSGYYPYYKKNTSTDEYEAHWNREAGKVYGNATVNITGGHILTSVFGGGEINDVGHFTYDDEHNNGGTYVSGGVVSVSMSGGTLGVPRTSNQIKAHPVTCYLFGAGKGDQRIEFNTRTNVKQTTVTVSGGTIYGSIFGGGEDGHVFYNTSVNVSDGIIGTTGRSTVDGNVFGGGRGFSGEALTAGVVRGDVGVNISGGTMLGSIYGGGRLAAVGTYLVPTGNTNYGNLIPDGTDGNHGNITVNITGGTIGNDWEAVYHTDFSQKPTGGNVFGGGMGRILNLDNTVNSNWPKFGMVKSTTLTINETDGTTTIKGNVYGGGEFGTVDKDATITMSNGTLMRDMYGGGLGSQDVTSMGNYGSTTITPQKLAGRVGGNTSITFEGGWIKKSIYGGGELATVGIIQNDSVAHTNEATSFALSWPYEMNYEDETGKTTINVTNGRVGITGSDYMGPFNYDNGVLKPVKYDNEGNATPLDDDEIDDAEIDNGDIYGGCKGYAADRYLEAHSANVRDTHISIDYTSCTVEPSNYKDNPGPTRGCVTGAVYGGGENGHVIDSTVITLTKGLVGHNIYGGGKGKGLYTATLNHYTVNPDGSVTTGTAYDTTIYSITAGKVYGDTYITMEGGYVVRNIFGGGNLASVGKGNYTGAPDDYSTTGYGECVAALTDTLRSGNTYVTVKGGQLGYLNPDKPDKVIKDGLPYGSVYGGCRGQVPRDVPRTLSPRIHYCPEDFLGYVNKTHVVIGSATGTDDGPRLYGSVYGGGQDGHVRWDTYVTVNKGEIGVDFGGDEKVANNPTINNDPNSEHWINRGNVYGAGSGIGQYETYEPNAQNPTVNDTIKHYSYISGSVTQFSYVTIKGGTIHNNVYGGGNLASVGPPRILQNYDCPNTKTGVVVNITGTAEIGKNTNLNSEYGGKVYGASRGIASEEKGAYDKPKYKDFAYCSYTEVNVDSTVTNYPVIYGSVFGGGENGKVGVYHEDRTTHIEDGQNIHNTTVNINGGIVKHSVYGGGQGVYDPNPSSPTYFMDSISGRVMGSTTVNLMGGTIGTNTGTDAYKATIFGGCRSANIWGNTEVNVGKVTHRTDTYSGEVTIYGSVYGANNKNGTPYGNATVNVYQTAHTTANTYPTHIFPDPPTPTAADTLEWLGGLSHEKENFAIYQVFGGSNQADYKPYAGKKATVNVFQCKENTICDVYGGSNAAHIGPARDGSSTDANVNIDGGRIYRVFGGGNGEVRQADIHGTAKTNINGGLINQVFGGSNTNGLVDNIDLNVNYDGPCGLYIYDVFGGGNNALVIGDVVTTVECCDASYGNFYGGNSLANIYGNVTVNIFGATYERLFAGSKGDLASLGSGHTNKSADIKKFPTVTDEVLNDPDQTHWPDTVHHPENVEMYLVYKYMKEYLAAHSENLSGTGGNVTLNLFGGTIQKAAYGGSDVNGNIEGQITVNVFNTATNCDLDLFDLYGASRNTAYEPLEATITSPVINVIHGPVKGSVYGGGDGPTALTKASPQVNMGYYDALGVPGHDGDIMDTLFKTIHAYTDKPGHPWEAPTDYAAFVYGNIYGGGNDGQVEGNTTVNVYEGEVGRIGYRRKTHSTAPSTVLDSIYHLEYDTDNHLIGGSVFGGGAGLSTNAVYGRVTGNSTVNISGGHVQYNVYGGGKLASVGLYDTLWNSGHTEIVDFTPRANTGLSTVYITGGQVGPAPKVVEGSYDIPMALNGFDGNVFGGGKGYGNDATSAYKTFANVNQTSVTVQIPSDADTLTNRLWGNIFGGAEDGHVLGDAYTYYKSGLLGTEGTKEYDGNIFGGGRNFNKKNTTAGRVGGNTHVEMSGGQICGNIFGGGSMALTGTGLNGIISLGGGRYQVLRDDPDANTKKYGHTFVKVKGGTVGNNTLVPVVVNGSTVKMPLIETFSDNSMGNVYGAGKGSEEGFAGYPDASALIVSLTKNTTVEISEDDPTNNPTRIWGIVFGGGEVANVGNYSWYQGDNYTNPVSNIQISEGLAKVRIHGGIIGADKAKMRYEAGAAPYNMYPRFNDDLGYVYGGGEGLAEDPANYSSVHTGATTEPSTSLVNLLATVNNTDVKITGGWVKASVFGGAESGHVRGNTKVTLKGGQIGAGDDGAADLLYKDGYNGGTNQFINPAENEINASNSLKGTFHWDFGETVQSSQHQDSIVYNPYDPSEIANSNTYRPTDGKSWFGNVFGGGSGWFPYIKNIGTEQNPKYESHWNSNSGKVWGNTEVIIADSIDGGTIVSRPHILNNVYGGNEMTDVGGSTSVTMSGGTVGVPRTREDINGSPTFGYIFGGGCGDPRPGSVFKTLNNVGGSTYVNITGGIVYGSLYGGAEDGHVIGDANINVSQTATTNPTIIGTAGTSDDDGNIFGGGRNYLLKNYTSGRVGGNDTIVMTNGKVLGSIYGGGRNAIIGLGEDVDVTSSGAVTALQDGDNHGKTVVKVKGGIVGNNRPIETGVTVPQTVIDTFTYNNMGCVYGGGMGNVNGVVGHTSASALLIALVKDSDVQISQQSSTVPTHVYGIVYGGGEMATVGNYTWNQDSEGNISQIAMKDGTGLAKVNISGGIIGGDRARMRYTLQSYANDDNFWPKYNDDLGYVYGGGKGSSEDPSGYDVVNTSFGDMHLIDIMAAVNNTEVTITGGLVKASVFGGAEAGHVFQNTKVTLKGGQIGVGHGTDADLPVYTDGINGTPNKFVNPAETEITTSLEGTFHWAFGKTLTGSQGDSIAYDPYDLVYLKKGATGIPSDGKSWFGNVFGGGSGWFPYVKKNEHDEYQCYWNSYAGKVWGNTEVIIADSIDGGTIVSRPHILNNVYGGNEATDVGGTAKITMSGGTVGVPRTREDINKLPTFGYVFGGGCGDPRAESKTLNNVGGNTIVDITGGIIYGSVYGGAEDGHVFGSTKVSVGQTDVAATPTNPTVIGSAGTSNDDGNIFGAGRNYLLKNYTAGRVGGNDTIVMTGGHVLGSIYGGGRNAATGLAEDVNVNLSTGVVTALQEDASTSKHGHTIVKVKGGKVGNPSVIETWTATSIGDVYGGGKGSMVGPVGHPAASPLLISLTKSTTVEISEEDPTKHKTYIYGNVFGGGEVANVGNYTWKQIDGTIKDFAIVNNTGKAKVDVSGGRIGVDKMVMSYELIGGDGPDKYYPATVSCGNVFGGGEGLSDNPANYATVNPPSSGTPGIYNNKSLLDLMATVGSTEVTIGTTGNPWVKGSVYGGAAMGHVWGNTQVTVDNGQIGAGYYVINNVVRDSLYNSDQFFNPTETTVNESNALKATNHWPYGVIVSGNTVYNPFDLVEIYKGITGAGSYPDDYTYKPSDGKTWFGNVYGGGSGFLPYVVGTGDAAHCEWNRDSGKVYGNSTVTINGGHILTNVYGGCETSDVGTYKYDENIHGEVIHPSYTSTGTATVTITGGTVGVPRTQAQIEAHPQICYVFGGGKGDPRLYFNTWTNVQKAVVDVKNTASVPTIIYGSVFGGGEEGHVLGNVDLDIKQASGKTTVIGTVGTSKVDGNVFGGGRGFSGTALTAGTVGGNVDIDIAGGTMLGSVYGGGRLASVGTYLVDAKVGTADNPYYGQFQPGTDHGHITINITDGTIGNTTETPSHANPKTIGGNVFGGCMGKFIEKTGTETPIWPSLARAKYTTVTINGTTQVKNSVYGGGEIGSVRDSTTVKIKGGTIGGDYNGEYCGHVFGGGMGFDEVDACLNTANDSTLAAGYLAGRVYGNTTVYIKGGHVYENVFGGGQVASVGFEKDGAPKKGVATVKMTGGIIGPLDYSGLNAYIFGGPKGGNNSQMKPYCNVNSTEVEVDYADGDANHLWGSIFGGGSDGHVLGSTSVTLTKGTVGTAGATGYDGNIFGGGRNYHESSLTAGRVGGNITVNMQGGQLMGNIFGGGRQGLTGVDVQGTAVDDADHGNITVTVSGGIVGSDTPHKYIGHVFGGGKGNTKQDAANTDLYKRFGEVRSTNVTIGGGSTTATVNGSVFGGSENGQVLKNATVTIAGKSTIGAAGDDHLQGNVYGGGRGTDPYYGTSDDNPYAGRVKGQTKVLVNGGTVTKNVFGGGEKGIVEQERIVNVDEVDSEKPTIINGSVYGGSYTTMLFPDPDDPSLDPQPDPQHGKLKTVNVRGGLIKGDVFGGSYDAVEGTAGDNYSGWASDRKWSSFVNITGGTIGTDGNDNGNVYGAGYGGSVNGSVCINVGYYPILNAPNQAANTCANVPSAPSATNTKDLVIKGNLYGGSHHAPTGPGVDLWNTFDITGYSVTYIDGTDYDTRNSTPTSGQPKFMNIEGGLYGCGTHCESGEMGRDIFLRNYGKRNATGGVMSSATRDIMTAQRCSNFVLDSANINFTGYRDISGKSDSLYAVVKINENLYVANASSMALGSVASPAYMDSIKAVHSTYLTPSDNVYDDAVVTSLPWGWIGLKANSSSNADELVYMNGTTSTADSTVKKAHENVMLFKGRSRMWVRYHTKESGSDKQLYGELQGFFRMNSSYQPYSNASFAYARPKLTVLNGGITSGGTPVNDSDGGFLSYNTEYNFHTRIADHYTEEGNDGGAANTKTKQYPYSNVMETSSKGDLEQFRLWSIPKITGNAWYVDGRTTGGIGVNNMYKGRGLYPDKPKLTVSADLSSSDPAKKGIYAGAYDFVENSTDSTFVNFSQKDDVIYVVGTVNSTKELAVVASGVLNKDVTKPLRLYRYPGGHTLSPTSSPVDPGANYKALVEVNENHSITLNNVVVDGLYGYQGFDGFNYSIPTSFNEKGTNMPMVITHAGSVLNLNDSTNLMKGYNNLDVDTISKLQSGLDHTIDNYYHNPDFTNSGITNPIYNGAALYVDATATVKVSGLVTIQGNKQRHMVGSNDHPFESNVYLPTFDKSLTISGALDAASVIGITSPIRNTSDSYVKNTFSPVAVADSTGATSAQNAKIAEKAYKNNNFRDDMGCFFVNGYTGGATGNNRSTYYDPTDPNTVNANLNNKTLFFGWTWANVVRKQPAGFTDGGGNVVIDSIVDLAWLVSSVNGLNGQTATALSGKTVKQTKDLDMQQYVWVPIGNSETSTPTPPADPESGPFSGQYNGQGHTISGLYIEYIGKGSRIYEYDNFGLFGAVTNGTVDLTFLTSGKISPNGAVNIGGLAGLLQTVGSSGTHATVKSSEAAISIVVPDKGSATGPFYTGGLVGQATNADIHSSIAVPDFTIGATSSYDYIGGLVGGTTGSTTNVLNSYANGAFNIGTGITGAGGLVGHAANLNLENCYVHLYDVGDLDVNEKKFGRLVYDGTDGATSTIKNVFAFKLADVGISQDYPLVKEPAYITMPTTCVECLEYNKVNDADTYRYLYNDNLVVDGELSKPLTMCLNEYLEHDAPNGLGGNKAYARWARAGVPEVNDDLPVLLWGNYDGDGNIGQGQLSCLGTSNGRTLQVGGIMRDPSNPIGNLIDHIPVEQDPLNPNGKGNRTGGTTIYIYGDQSSAITFGSTTPEKVVICEDAAILQPGDLATFDSTYVGVRFENPSRSALDAYGNVLERDWHMFSSPLANAPLGMDYTLGGATPDQNLNGNYASNQYVYKPTDWNYSTPDASLPIYPFTTASSPNGDGYFPSSPPASSTDYGYEYDFYTWYEPDWQWINFKRNGVSHWHYDPKPGTEDHYHIKYHYDNDTLNPASLNKNETTLVPGKGYMMAIEDNTFLQSHGRLNSSDVTIKVTNSVGTQTWSWMPGSLGYYGNNFVGNPYHSYLDFDAFAADGENSAYNVYYIYIATIDTVDGKPRGGYRQYTKGSSLGGAYAPRFLHPHQGFFIRKGSNDPIEFPNEITFKSSMGVTRSTAKNSEFRDWRPNYPLVNLFAYDSDGREDVVVIEFNRPENGGGEKVKTLRSGNHLIYAHNGDTDYGAFFAEEGTSRVPVRFMSLETEQKPYTLRWNTQNGFFNSLYLIDNLLGITYDMLANDSYTFVGSKEDYVSRFVIVFNVTDVEENTDPKTFAFYDGNTWVVNGTGRLEVIDVTGRILYTEDLHNEQNHVNLNRYAKGVYVLRLWKHDKASIQKIVKY